MSKLEDFIQEKCPNGVVFLPLEACCHILDNKRRPVTKSSRLQGDYPYYGANGILDYVSEYIFDGRFVLVGEDGSVITTNGNPVVNWAEGKLWVNNHAHIIAEKDGVLLRYLFHYLQIIDVSKLIHGNIPKLTGGDFRVLRIPIPPLEVQQEIVRILDSFTELTAELTAELTIRKQQYEYYLDHKFHGYKNSSFTQLSNIVDVRDGTHDSPKQADKGYPLVTSKNIAKGVVDLTTCYLISDEEYISINKRSKVDQFDLLISMIGTVGEVAFVKEKPNFAIKNVGLLKLNGDINKAKFLKYYLTGTTSQNYISANVRGTAPRYLSLTALREMPIPDIPFEEQLRIVSILDQFDTLVNDINEGLPAEINARQKQYVYYRDKLLNFKEHKL